MDSELGLEVRCDGCGSETMLMDSGYFVCTSCGLVNTIHISNEGEWNNYDGVDNSRCGLSECEPFMESLTTFVPKGSRSFVVKNGRLVSTDISSYHFHQSINSKQISYNTIKNVFDNMSNYTIGVINMCKNMWVEIIKSEKIFRGGVRKGLIGNCVYYSCLINNVPRTSNEICTDLNIETKDFNKGNKIFMEIFENNNNYNIFLKNNEINDYFLRLCSILSQTNVTKLNPYVIQKECLINYNNNYEKINNLSLNTIVYGILYYTCLKIGIKISKSEFSKKFDICIPSLTKIMKIIE